MAQMRSLFAPYLGELVNKTFWSCYQKIIFQWFPEKLSLFFFFYLFFLKLQLVQKFKSDNDRLKAYAMRWAIWYHLYNLNNVKNIHGGVLLLVI